MTDHPSYFDMLDLKRMQDEHPIGNAFLTFAKAISRDELRARQNVLFMRSVKRAWDIPFYRRLWGARGIEPGDIRSLDDIGSLPVFDKSDIMASIAAHPPLGDFHGIAPGADRPPVILHTTSGTTGKPQVLLFGPRSREIQNLLLARMYRLMGLGAGDVVHSVYGHGPINGGHYIRETVTHWTNALFISAGTGVETRSVQQVEMMRDFGATAIVGFADYIKRLADVAREIGIDPVKDLKVRRLIGHLGRENREALSHAWGGAECFDWYGVGDTGVIAAEGPDHAGLYVQEDAQYLEICDIDTGAALTDGMTGDMVNTCLFKDDIYPIIRFNTHDVSRVLDGASPMGLAFRRIEGFLGRSDAMVKLRGINIFPQAMAPILEEMPEFAGEYLCECVRDASGRDEMIVRAEIRPGAEPDLGAWKALLKRKVGIEVEVRLEPHGALKELTGIETRQKPIRLIDRRFK
jgi:phenylacetate-CoA ligase